MKVFALLVKKDLLIELRSRETLALILALSLLLAVITAFGVSSAFLPPNTVLKIFPLLIWLVFVFSSTVCIGKSFDYELEHMGVEGLILAGTPAAVIYLAKVSANFLAIISGHLFSLFLLSILLNVEILPLMPALLFISLLVACAYSALSTLLAAMAASSRLKNMLLPLILMPLLFPAFFAALETTADLFAQGFLDFNSFWLLLLFGLDLLYIMLGILLYGFVIQE